MEISVGAARGKPRVLIVDDAAFNLGVLAETLRAEYELDLAASGAQALAHVVDRPPDLILLDILMPDMDGYEVCRRLKASERTRGIPVIFVSALHEVQDKSRGFALGAVDYITKPFQVAEVRARVRTHLEIARYKRELEQQNRELRATRTRLQQQIRELQARDQLVHAQMLAPTPAVACQTLLQALHHVLGCTQAIVYLPDRAGETLHPGGALGCSEPLPPIACSDPEALVALACRRLEPRSDASGQVAVPLVFHQRPLGVLWVGDMPAVEDRESALHSLWRLAGEGTLLLRAARLTEQLESGDFGLGALLDVG